MKKMKFKLLLLIILVQIIYTKSLFSSHAQGGEITYKWLGGKKYEVTAKFYRDCSGIPLTYLEFKVQAFGINSIDIPYTRVSIEDVTLRCKDSTRKLCNPPNTSNGIGFSSEVHTLVGYVDFDDTLFNKFLKNSNCEIYFTLSNIPRNNNITNINATGLHVESMVNICESKFKNTSPQFKNTNVFVANCNRALYQNYGAKDFNEFDSLRYELVAPMNGKNSYETYVSPFSKNYPVTPLCSPFGAVNCNASPTANPPRGFYFNPENADIIFTPTDCDEVSVIAIKTKEFRKDSAGNWKLIGYVIRDIQLVIYSGDDRNYYPKFKKNYFVNYKFKTRVETCIDFETYDTTNSGYFMSGNLGDYTFLEMKELPPGATFKLLDSSARLQTGRFCWKAHDSVFSKLNTVNKRIPLTIELKDNFCERPIFIQRSFTITLLPPDSLSNINLNTFIDRNKDSIKNNNEQGFSTSLKFKDNKSVFYIPTNDSGYYRKTVKSGKYHIGITQHPYIKHTTKDTLINIVIDSSYNLKFGATLNAGIYGRIYEDKNTNCKYDDGEPTFEGYKVFTDSNKYLGISDKYGIYYIKAPAGTYNIKCAYNGSKLQVNCPSTNNISITTLKDSAYLNNDFGISKNKNYTDISSNIKLTRLRRGEYATVDVAYKNEGFKTVRYINTTTSINPSIKMDYWNGTAVINNSTITQYIDSLAPGQTKYLKMTLVINPNLFKAGDIVCVESYTDNGTTNNDSLKYNNISRICGIINAPYDPNNKQIMGDSIKTTLDKYATYTVQFQNSGTDTATRVVVTDTLDTELLNLENFKLNWADYPCETIIEGNIIHFIFDNINLATLAKSGDKSIGKFNFTVGINSNIKKETLVENKVSIYFDYEEAVVTKPSLFAIVSPIEIKKLKYKDQCENEKNTVYINSKIKVESGNVYTLKIIDSSNNLRILNSKISNLINDSFDFELPKNLKSGKYKLIITTSKPFSESIPTSGNFELNTIEKPKFSFLNNLINNTACNGDTLKLATNNTNYSYKYIYNQGINTPFINNYTYNTALKTNDTIIIIALNNNFCKDTQTIIPIINPLPISKINVINRKKEYCNGDSIHLNFSDGNMYQLFENNIMKTSTTNPFIKFALNNNSIYKLKTTNTFNCSEYSDTINIISNPTPKVNIKANVNNLSIGAFNGSIKWYKNGQLMSDTDSILINATSGSYYVIVTDKKGCITKSETYNHSITKLNQLFFEGIKLYPNPSNNFIIIENANSEHLYLEIIDISGKMILENKLISQINKIDIQKINSGIYFVKLSIGNIKQKVFKINVVK